LEIAAKEGLDTGERRIDGAEVRKCVLAGFSDQLVQAASHAGTLRCELVHHRKGLLARESVIQKTPLFVAAEISEIEGRRRGGQRAALGRDRNRGGLAEGNLSPMTTGRPRA